MTIKFLRASVETEVGSAGVQPAEGYPKGMAPNQESEPGRRRRPGSLPMVFSFFLGGECLCLKKLPQAAEAEGRSRRGGRRPVGPKAARGRAPLLVFNE